MYSTNFESGEAVIAQNFSFSECSSLDLTLRGSNGRQPVFPWTIFNLSFIKKTSEISYISLKAFSSPWISPFTVPSFVFMQYPRSPSFFACSSVFWNHATFFIKPFRMKTKIQNFTFLKKTPEKNGKLIKILIYRQRHHIHHPSKLTLHCSEHLELWRENWHARFFFKNQIESSFNITNHHNKGNNPNCFHNRFHFAVKHFRRLL